MPSPPRRRLPSGKLGPEPEPTPKRRLLKARHKVLIVVVIAFAAFVYYEGRRHHHVTTARPDRSDLVLEPGTVHVTAGHAGTVEIRVVNRGPDRLGDHTVTFTVSTAPGLVMTGGGRVVGDSDTPFPDAHCVPQAGGHAMTCRANLTLGTKGQLLWRIPVRVDAGAGGTLRLTVTAAGSTFYVDPDGRNNTKVAYSVIVGRSGPAPSRSPSPSHRPSPAPTASHRAGHPARDALAPVTIVVVVPAGLMAVVVIVLVFVARRQRRKPVGAVPPPGPDDDDPDELSGGS